MKFKTVIKYVYAETSEKMNHLEINRIHQISDNALISILAENNFILSRENLITLLKSDGAFFHNDSLRIFDNLYQTFLTVPEDFELEIDEKGGKEILLWIKAVNAQYRKKVDDIGNSVRSLKAEIEKMNSKIENILSIQKILSNHVIKASQQPIPVPTIRASRSALLPSHHDNIIPEDYSDALSIQLSTWKSSNSGQMEIPSMIDLRKQNSVMKMVEEDSPIDRLKPRVIDLAIIYSEPLVKRVGKNLEPLGDPVDYEEECNKLLETLQAKKKKIDIIFEIASHDRLVNVISKGPVILHIICHGEYNNERGQFHLCFEAENGELYEFYSEDLSAITESVELKIKLVFVNACHSEEVAKVFVDAGVPCVIAIQSELRIADNVAQKFSQHFYDQLFEGRSIKEAFELAKIAARSVELHTCCCAHAHKPNCRWYTDYAKKIGFRRAHQLHVPLCNDCKDRNQHIHKSGCSWAAGFQFDFEIDCFECPSSNLGDDKIFTCCCSPELPHNESQKFKKFCQSPDVDQMVLFPQKYPGKVSNKNPYSVIEQKFPVKRISGRNKDLHQLYEYLTKQDHKFVQLNGSEGVGKTTLVKQLANYLYERGHFRDKICIIMLEKTPSISHFLSDLYKEVPGTFDFKSFCESIKLSKILFILEKCDMLLENYKDDFISRLREISNSAKYVKFVIIKNEYERLRLDELSITMQDLQPYDAANILLSFAYDYLQVADRKIDDLAERDLFKKIKFTPQRIWCISERLKHEDLSSIEQEFLQSNISDASKGAEGNEHAVDLTLRTIQSKSQSCYELVLFLGLFHSGLSTYDMNQLAKLEIISEDWKVGMKRLLRSPTEIAELNNDIEEQNDNKEYFNSQSDFELLKPGNYFWIVLTKDLTKDILYYQPAQFVNRFIEKRLKLEVVMFSLWKLEYMTLIALSIIKRLKDLYYYHEKVVENSCISNHGLWTLNTENSFYEKYLKDARSYAYIDTYTSNYAFDLASVKKVFEMHETNFLSCLDSQSIRNIIETDGSLYGNVIDLVEIMWVAIPTLFKLISTRESGARDLALRALSIINDIKYEDGRICLLRAKLHLFLASIYLHEKSEEGTVVNTINSELEDIEKIQEGIQKDDVHKALKYYTAFTKANMYYKIRKGRYTKFEKTDHKKHSKKYEDILQILKECDALLLDLGEEYDVERCKVAIMTSKITLRTLKTRRGIDAKNAERVKLSIGIFGAYNLKRLEVAANYQLALIRLNLKQYHTNFNIKAPQFNSTQNPANQTELPDSKFTKLTEFLAQAKNHYLYNNALPIAKLINDKAFEAKIKRLIDEINTEIRHGYYNVIILMRSAPIVEMLPKQQNALNPKTEIESKSVGFPTRVASYFKNDVLRALHEKGKTLYLKFEILTKVNLIDTLRNGCRVMQLNCHVIHPDGIMVEDSIGRAELVTFAELQEIFASRTNSTNATFQSPLGLTSQAPVPVPMTGGTNTQGERYLDILILGSKNDPSAANFFVEELKVPHVITFMFINKEFDFRHKLYEDECVDKFSQFFLEDIVEGLSVRDAFTHAYQRTFDFLSTSFFDSRDNTYIEQIIGEGPVLLPERADHSESLYGTEENILNQGRIEDISSVRFPTNIVKSVLPYTGRNNDICGVARLLVTKRLQFVKLTGDPGVGKTAFALHTSYFLLTRNIFPDGIFYFSLKAMQNQELKDIMKDTFGPKFENNMKNFFRDKKMLLIFDDFDIFYQKSNEFPRLIFLTLRECEIATLVITTNIKKRSDISAKKKLLLEYENKQKIIEEEFLSTERVIKPLKDEEMAYILLSLIKVDRNMDVDISRMKMCPDLRQAEGNPKVMINNLIDKKIILDKKILEISSNYIKHTQIEQAYLGSPALSHQGSTNLTKIGLSRHSSLSTENLRTARNVSTISAKSSHQASNKDLSVAIPGKAKSKGNSFSSHFRESYDEKRDKTLNLPIPSIVEIQMEKTNEKSDDEVPRANRSSFSKNSRFSAPKAHGRHDKEKIHLNRHDSSGAIKDTSSTEEKSFFQNNIDLTETELNDYEERKSNDANEFFTEMNSSEDEKYDEFEDNSKLYCNKDDLHNYNGDDYKKGYFSHGDVSMADDSLVSDSFAELEKMFEKSGSFYHDSPDGSGDNSTTFTIKQARSSLTKKKSVIKPEKKAKPGKTGRQVKRYTKAKKNKYMAQREQMKGPRKDSTMSQEED